jgi:prepilin peptidase CpaA
LLKTFEPIVVCAVAGGGASSAAIDLRVRRVPNPMTLGITAVGLILAAFQATSVTIGGALVGLVLGFALMLPGHVIGATGAGDVKLMAALGTLLGPGRTGSAFMYTAIAGGVIALVVAARRRRMRVTIERTAALLSTSGTSSAAADIEHPREDNRFAYAPAIAIGALVAALGL